MQGPEPCLHVSQRHAQVQGSSRKHITGDAGGLCIQKQQLAGSSTCSHTSAALSNITQSTLLLVNASHYSWLTQEQADLCHGVRVLGFLFLLSIEFFKCRYMSFCAWTS